VARFEAERQALALMDHPHIARVFDAGATANGRPYFVMELVPGVPITQYCDEARLSTRERLELFQRVCEAVQHAHMKGIIHRDLKPGNVLVTLQDGRPMPKVIDFGIAKATSGQPTGKTAFTGFMQMLGTLPYMSPEQVLGDPRAMDVRSDVYALGILLYELLSGRLPYPVCEAALPEAARIICEDEPTPLESVDRSLRGDLATIAARALEKDRQRRYQSAAELGADIRHFLADEPIMARPASTLYQLGKMARRHRAAFVALGFVLLALAGAAIVSTWMAVVAGRAEVRAVEALRESEGASSYLLDLFMESPDRPIINRQELLEQAGRRLIDRPLKDARVEANIREYIGHGWHKLGYLEIAEPHLARALEIRRARGVRDADLAECLLLMAMQRLTQGRIAAGQEALREALAIRRELFGPADAAGAEDSELMYWTTLYVPEEPEAVREFERRRRLREAPPLSPTSSLNVPIVFEDEFDGTTLDPEWSIESGTCAGWTHVVGDSRLTVTDIAPPARADAPEDGTAACVRLTRALDRPLGDFRVEARIGWDSEDRREALQYLVVYAFSDALLLISSVQYGDDWLQFGGARKASIGRYGPTCRHVNSGKDTLLDRGEAQLAIERIGDRFSVYWDGRELMRGLSSDPLTRIGIGFSWTVHTGLDGSSSFGSEWIDSIRVMGPPR
jgi:hypothetical protein